MSAQPLWSTPMPERAVAPAQQPAHAVETLLQRCPGRSQAHRERLLQRLLRAQLRIAAGDYLGAGVDQVAADCSLSRWYFARIYGRLFGQHPQQALIEARLRRARGLLGETGWTISEIALHCGFETPGSLSRACLQRFGASPSQLRMRAGASLASRSPRVHSVRPEPFGEPRARLSQPVLSSSTEVNGSGALSG